MPNGTIGKFAMGKIKEAFEEANNFVSEKQGTLETAQYVNSIIGEEVYHYYLEELLNKTEDVQ